MWQNKKLKLNESEKCEMYIVLKCIDVICIQTIFRAFIFIKQNFCLFAIFFCNKGTMNISIFLHIQRVLYCVIWTTFCRRKYGGKSTFANIRTNIIGSLVQMVSTFEKFTKVFKYWKGKNTLKTIENYKNSYCCWLTFLGCRKDSKICIDFIHTLWGKYRINCQKIVM